MQREPGSPQLSRRLRALVRVCAALLVVGVAMPRTVNAAGAEANIAHARTRPEARQSLVATDHTKTQGHAGRVGAAKSVGKNSANMPAKRVPPKGVVATAKVGRGALGAEVEKPSVRVGQFGHKHQETVRDDEPVVMHRVESEQGRGGVVAPSGGVRRTKVVVAPVETATAPVATKDETKPLTVDDFMRAASAVDETPTAAVGKTYVRGESRTEEDNRIAGQRSVVVAPKVLAPKPVVARRAVIAAKIEANTADENAPADIVSAPPTNLDDTPLMVSADLPEPMVARARGVRSEAAIAPLPALTREQMTEEVEQPVMLPGLYRNGRLVVPAPLKGTHEILVHQNLMADDEGLERIEDEDDLRRLRAARLLIDFPESASLHVNPELAADRRCARVWTVRFASDIARGFYGRFHEPLQVNSAVRTVAYQVRLQRTNGNAAGVDGEAASPHLTGQALDLGKRGMSLAQIAWMRSYLLPLMQAGKVDVEEEFQQACFHISVYRTYMPVAPAKRRVPRTEVAQLRLPKVVKSPVISDK
jgi:hypothetical protein